MKPVLLTQRVDVLAHRGERRDAVDQRFVAWLASAGFLAVPLPNEPGLLQHYWDAVHAVGVVFSGGNDLVEVGGDAPERDATERALLTRCLHSATPVFAVCRGLQLVVQALGGTLRRVEGHAGSSHRVSGSLPAREVNSYHRFAVDRVPIDMVVMARADDGVVEAVRHVERPLLAVQWHPERAQPFCGEDTDLLVELFERR